ncbi:TIGR03862 family flavoprotein [Lichenicola sp.]|uniref:TIGR03862 family flavoprotein n=1 Tax=Lichenicola sp. TaxID=2804529 RepID=UPI003B00E816
MAEPTVAVIGAGPAGLAAAELLAPRCRVTVYDRMPSPGRKLLMAGRGGLNITHSEPLESFLQQYEAAEPWLRPAIEAFPPAALRDWAEALGQPCFVGSSGRVFPRAMKASPLLRAWLARLDGLGVTLRTRCRFAGFDDAAAVRLDTPDGPELIHPDATLLALGGASWARLGSDGAWSGPLADAGVPVVPFRPANCGFVVGWSAPFAERHSGTPLKSVALRSGDRMSRGDMIVTADGLEGGAVYPLAAALRDEIERTGRAVLTLDLRPDMQAAELAARLARVRGRESLSNTLRKALSLAPVAIGLLREIGDTPPPRDPVALAGLLKALPIVLTAPAEMDRAISTAGGVSMQGVDDRFMLRARPGSFVAGEMLDWEAPTGGYLLQAAIATGRAAAHGLLAWLAERIP